MAEWVLEHGIGETRAALIAGDRIVEARIIPDGELIAGTVVAARLVARMPERGQGVVAWDGHEALVSPLPVGVTQGALCEVEIVRPAIAEPGKPKRALARPASSDRNVAHRPHPSDAARLPHSPDKRGKGAAEGGGKGEGDLTGEILRPTDPDRLEAAGWSELLEQAASRNVAFPGGSLSIHPTPAMTLIDVDGTLPASELAVAGARAAAQAIRRLDIAGSIGIDLPGGDKASRSAAAEAIDAALPQPFERTAVNGFGFVQIIRPRRRRSLIELYADDAALAHARALLRRAERTGGAGERMITAHPAVIAAIAARPDWTDRLSAQIGAPIALQARDGISILAGHVQARFA